MAKSKKIYDILPPKKIKEEEKEEVSQLKKLSESKKSFGERSIFILFSVLAISAIFCLVFIKPKIEIEVWPEKEFFEFRKEVIIDGKINRLDFSKSLIPGKYIEEEKIISQEFSSSATVLKKRKARGVIRVYNNYSTFPQAFIANTRFMSESGKVFKTPKRIVVPGKEFKKGKWVAGFCDVEVVAVEEGEEYNIGPSVFSLPALSGTPLYTKFYGQSFSPMKGGFKKEVPQVTQQDLDNAKQILSKRGFKESELSLKAKVPSEYVLVEDAINQEVVEVFPLVEAGQEVERFTFQIKIKSKALVFKKSDLEDFSKWFIYSQIKQDQDGGSEDREIIKRKEIQEQSLKLNWRVKDVNLRRDKIILSLEGSCNLYPDISRKVLKEMVKGKTPVQIKDILKKEPQIIKSQIKIWPFWIKQVPYNLKRIEIKLNL